MKKQLLTLLAVCFVISTTSQVFAISQFRDDFKKMYAGEKASDDYKKLVKDASCNVCHVAKENKKKVRNVYGKALHELIEKSKFPIGDYKKAKKAEDKKKFEKQVQELFTKVAEMESGDEEHKTFADRIKAGLLPGGDKDGK